LAGTTLMRNPTDELFAAQWYLDPDQPYGIRIAGAADSALWSDHAGQGVSVVVFDQGIDPDHPDLAGRIDREHQWDTVLGIADASPRGPGDIHGTAVAGVIAAELNGVGSVGVAPAATLVPVYSPMLFAGFADQIAAAFDHAQGFDVINNSWSFGNLFRGYRVDGRFQGSADEAFADDFSEPEFAAAAGALARLADEGRGGLGTIVVQAAGNTRQFGDDVNLHNFQNSRHAITVAASTAEGTAAPFSTPGAAILIAAPGVGIVTTDRVGDEGYTGSDYVALSGTSMAAPIVSGIVALMLEANPRLGWRDVQEILVASARASDLGVSAGWQTNGAGNWNGGGHPMSHDVGAGLVDAHAAVRLAETWETQHTSADELAVSATAAADLAIPDGDVAGVVSAIAMPEGLRIDRVEVTLRIDHPWIGDLVAVLTSPAGTASTLVHRPGLGPAHSGDVARWYGSGQADIDFVFGTTHHWGEGSAGAWTLTVADGSAGFQGRLVDWTLTAYGDPEGDDTYVYTEEFAALASADPARRTLADAAGIDGVNAAAVAQDSVIDLEPGAFGSVGGIGIQIAADTWIENAQGGDGGDLLAGNWLANRLAGGRGNDVLLGNAGDDRLDGGPGDDRIEGGAGSNWLTGGPGADTFVFSGAFADDVIGDFDVAGGDRLLFHRSAAWDLGALDSSGDGRLDGEDLPVRVTYEGEPALTIFTAAGSVRVANAMSLDAAAVWLFD
jgi:subtilisin-like proprotein convertase family protein